MKDVRLLQSGFVPDALIASFTRDHPGLGGVCSFVGQVRSGADGEVEWLELSHYEPLTLSAMNELADNALTRFDLLGLLIAHRVGVMRAGEPIVCVSAAARHRRDAIEAVDYTMDHLKSASWFWKREKRDGQWQWIEPREQDHSDLARWDG